MTEVRADWYPDPEDAAKLRYWDGQAWTSHVAAPAEGAGSPQPSSSSGDGDPSAAELQRLRGGVGDLKASLDRTASYVRAIVWIGVLQLVLLLLAVLALRNSDTL